MACKVGVLKRYKPQPAPTRWGATYRCSRRQSIKAVWQWQQIGSKWIRVKLFDRKIWGDIYYSERHLKNYCKGKNYRAIKRRKLEMFTQASAPWLGSRSIYRTGKNVASGAM